MHWILYIDYIHNLELFCLKVCVSASLLQQPSYNIRMSPSAMAARTVHIRHTCTEELRRGVNVTVTQRIICVCPCSNHHRPWELYSCDSGPFSWLWPSHCQLLLDCSGQWYLWWSKHHLHCYCQLPEWLWGCQSIHPPSKLFPGDTRSPCLCQPHSHTGSRERQWKQQWHCKTVLNFRPNWWVSYVAVYTCMHQRIRW